MRKYLLLWILVGCSGSVENGGTTPDARPMVVDGPIFVGDGGNRADATPGADGGSFDAPPPIANDAGQALCEGESGGQVVCECSDGMNNDGDGLIDAADPECTGPQDNDESSYATGIPGDNRDKFVQDCFFDGDSGGGNDGCRWDIRCIDPPGTGQNCNNNQLAGCEKCKPLVPNGCDCFGCCDVFVGGVAHTVRIVEGCTADVIDDPDKCPVCTKVTSCQNTCEPCEVCIGRPEPDPSCQSDAGPGGQCPTGIFACPPPDYSCSEEERCVTGCCQKFLD